MLDEQLISRSRGLVSAERPERRKAFADVLRDIRNEMVRRGIYASSMAVNAFRRAAEDELRTRGLLIWASLRRVHITLGASKTTTIAEDLKREVEKEIDEDLR